MEAFAITRLVQLLIQRALHMGGGNAGFRRQGVKRVKCGIGAWHHVTVLVGHPWEARVGNRRGRSCLVQSEVRPPDTLLPFLSPKKSEPVQEAQQVPSGPCRRDRV